MNIESKGRIFLKNNFNNIVNRNFSEFIQIDSQQTESSVITIDDFFSLYEDLFYSIDKEGDSNSHRYILLKTLSYLGETLGNNNVNELIDEINLLNNELLSVTKELDYVKNAGK